MNDVDKKDKEMVYTKTMRSCDCQCPCEKERDGASNCDAVYEPNGGPTP